MSSIDTAILWSFLTAGIGLLSGICVNGRMRGLGRHNLRRMMMAGLTALMLTAGSAATVSAMPLAPLMASTNTIEFEAATVTTAGSVGTVIITAGAMVAAIVTTGNEIGGRHKRPPSTLYSDAALC
jgi:hypothetical protein